MSAKTVGLSDHFDVNCRDARIRFFKAIPPQPLFFLYGNSKGKTLKVNSWLSNYGMPRVLPSLPIPAPLQCAHISYYIHQRDLDWPSPPGTFNILIGKFSYFIIRFLNHIFFVIIFSYFVITYLLTSPIVKSDNEIGKVNDKKNLI